MATNKRLTTLNISKLSFEPIIPKSAYKKRDLWMKQSKKVLTVLKLFIKNIEPRVVFNSKTDSSFSIYLNNNKFTMMGYVRLQGSFNEKNIGITIHSSGSTHFSAPFKSINCDSIKELKEKIATYIKSQK